MQQNDHNTQQTLKKIIKLPRNIDKSKGFVQVLMFPNLINEQRIKAHMISKGQFAYYIKMTDIISNSCLFNIKQQQWYLEDENYIKNTLGLEPCFVVSAGQDFKQINDSANSEIVQQIEQDDGYQHLQENIVFRTSQGNYLHPLIVLSYLQRKNNKHKEMITNAVLQANLEQGLAQIEQKQEKEKEDMIEYFKKTNIQIDIDTQSNLDDISQHSNLHNLKQIKMFDNFQFGTRFFISYVDKKQKYFTSISLKVELGNTNTYRYRLQYIYDEEYQKIMHEEQNLYEKIMQFLDQTRNEIQIKQNARQLQQGEFYMYLYYGLKIFHNIGQIKTYLEKYQTNTSLDQEKITYLIGKFGSIMLLEVKSGVWSNLIQDLDTRYRNEDKQRIFIYKTTINDQDKIFDKYSGSRFIQRLCKNTKISEYFACTFFGLLHSSCLFLQVFYENDSVQQIQKQNYLGQIQTQQEEKIVQLEQEIAQLKLLLLRQNDQI